MQNLVFLFLCLLLISCAHSQENKAHLVGGPCEGCEAVLEYGDEKLNSIDTLPGFEKADKKLKISGTIFKADGKAPAKNIILYIHHTNAEGIYPTKGDEKGWARRHGYIRGWVKTGNDGRYTFYTQVPGSYPTRDTPAHIHPYILEPSGKYYWLESFFFEDDPLLKEGHLEDDPRGGSSGKVAVASENGILTIERNFILGKNIPGYQD